MTGPFMAALYNKLKIHTIICSSWKARSQYATYEVFLHTSTELEFDKCPAVISCITLAPVIWMGAKTDHLFICGDIGLMVFCTILNRALPLFIEVRRAIVLQDKHGKIVFQLNSRSCPCVKDDFTAQSIIMFRIVKRPDGIHRATTLPPPSWVSPHHFSFQQTERRHLFFFHRPRHHCSLVPYAFVGTDCAWCRSQLCQQCGVHTAGQWR
jgi:hypothetical protein